ncbi:MAG: lysylphosphatidylglycerol synthase domain-containing protein [candidate division WOR-3 bacterium]
MNKKEKIFNVVLVLIVIAIVFFIFYKLFGYIKQVDFRSIKFNFFFLILSFMMIPIWYFFMCFSFKRILISLGHDVDLYTLMRIIGISMFGKYIPGKLWFTVGRIALLERVGVPKKKSFTAVVLETYLLLLTGAFFFLVTIIRSNQNILYIILSLIFFLFFILLSFPTVFKKVINLLFKFLKKDKFDFVIGIYEYIFIMFLYFLVWIFSGVEFYFLIYSFTLKTYDFIGLLSVYPSSWVVGFLSILMPAGIGVREGMIFFLLKEYTGVEIAAVGSLLSRIQVTIGEIFYLFFFIGDKKIWRKNEK